MNIPHTTRLITRRDVAERWSYSIETIKRLEKSGKLPVAKITSGQARYRLADIELIEKQSLINAPEGTK
jgi:predicted site-specific integrase-resolvase